VTDTSDGPPVPPPPPIAGMSVVKPTKPMLHPKTKLRALHWNRIILSSKSDREPSIWDQMNDEIPLDTTEIETLFSAVSTKPSRGEEGKEERLGKTPAKPKAISVLDGKRSNAIAIMASRLPPEGELSKAIDSLDTKKMSKEAISALIANPPTEDEIALIRSVEDPSALDKPERILLCLSNLPLLSERLKIWLFQLELEELKREVEIPLRNLREAIKEVRSSETLKRVLSIVLSIGNYLNGGTNRGQADGFSLEALCKLSMVKDVNNQTTLSNYVLKLYKKKYFSNQTMKGFSEELSHLDAALRVSLEDIKAKIADIQRRLSDAQSFIQVTTASNDLPLQKFNDEFVPFLKNASSTTTVLYSQMNSVMKDFTDLQIYLGLSEQKAKSLDPESFFSSLKEFTTSFQKDLEQMEKNIQAQNNQTKASERSKIRPGQKVGNGGADPLAQLANAIRLGANPAVLKKRTTNT